MKAMDLSKVDSIVSTPHDIDCKGFFEGQGEKKKKKKEKLWRDCKGYF